MDLPTTALQPGDVVERYEVLGLIGEGATAEVYRVRHTLLGTEHALKLLTHVRPGLLDRFLQEGRVQAGLRHPNIVAVTDVLPLDGQPCLIQELVRGPSLRTLLAEDGPLAPDAAVRLLVPVAEAVAVAHAQGVLHRDLKPDNILVAPGPPPLPKVTDFGIAKVLAEGRQATAARSGGTRQDAAMGTPGFMAPEQWADAASVDARADVFGLAAVLYMTIAGQPPFPLGGVAAMEAPLTGDFPPLDEVVPDCPPELAAVVARGLAPRPEDRFPDAAAMAEALAPFAGPAAATPTWHAPEAARVAVPPAPAPSSPPSAPTAVPDDLPDAPPPDPQPPDPQPPGVPARRAPAPAALLAGAAALLPVVVVVAAALMIARTLEGPGDRIAIPAVTAWHGDVWGDGRSDERPARQVTVAPFEIDRTEVRTEAYLACVEAGTCTPPAWADAPSPGEETDSAGPPDEYAGLTGPDQPIVGVTWDQAVAYCAWRDGRLPTEVEWEVAATWTPDAADRVDKRRWPWGGASPDCTRGAFEGCGEHSAPVGSHPEGASAFGVEDLVGNVWEWTASRYPTRKRLFRKAATSYVLRGGSYTSTEPYLRPTFRRRAPTHDARPVHGFRCAYGGAAEPDDGAPAD